MAKNKIRIKKKKKNTKSSKKRTLHLIKKLETVHLKHAFVRALRFRGKKPQGLCTLRFALKRAFNNTGYRVGSFPMTYLGMPLGASHKSPSIWNPILERIE